MLDDVKRGVEERVARVAAGSYAEAVIELAARGGILVSKGGVIQLPGGLDVMVVIAVGQKHLVARIGKVLSDPKTWPEAASGSTFEYRDVV